MLRRYPMVMAAAVALAACGGQSSGEVAPAAAATDCQGAWAVQVQNQTYEMVQVYYARGSLGTQQRAGEINPQDTKVLFFR